MENKITYTLKEPEEENQKTDILARLVDKHGEVQTESMAMKLQRGYENDKIVKEQKSKLEYEKAKRDNIEHFHPFVKDFTEEQLHTLAMYAEISRNIKTLELTITDNENTIQNWYKNLEELLTQIPELRGPVEEHLSKLDTMGNTPVPTPEEYLPKKEDE